jgi:anaerobic ribonucleoside-triphosphate reductase activating protein
MAYLNLASIRLCTESEGPGKRLAIWCQGCNRGCAGCCNVKMQEIKKNIIVETADLMKIIKKSADDYDIEGVSFIGGEPILQAEGFSEIAEFCRRNNLSVLLFSGYLYQELIDLNNEYVNKLLANADILVDGPYRENEYDHERDWIGSRNQRIYFLSDRYMPGIEYKQNERSMEILVSQKDILINGWPFI